MMLVGGAADEPTGSLKHNRDANLDGWNDQWAEKYPDAERSVTADSNGDGVPNFIEMMLDLDPFAKPQPPRLPDPGAARRHLARKKESEARIRKALAPYMNRGLRDPEGSLTTRAARLDGRRTRLLQLKADRDADRPAREVRIKAFIEGGDQAMPEELRGRLKDVVDGRPIFSAPMSHQQAINNSILPLWPGGLSNTDLTGFETAVAMWDFGAVQASHEQFSTGTSTVVDPGQTTGRVYNDPLVTEPSEHATAVATVIIGSGDPSDTTPATSTIDPNSPMRKQARGMAYEGGIRVYNQLFDISGMMALGTEVMAGNLDIVFSNHAYGTPSGWQKPYAPANAEWIWYGDPNMDESANGEGDGDTDYKFGFYAGGICDTIDEIVHTSEIYLPIWAAGNERMNLDPVVAPEPQESGFSSTTAHFVAMTNEFLEKNDAPNRKSDERPRSFLNSRLSNLIPEACCKNVLTVGENLSGGASSYGPTDDLRIKPDIMASSGGGSSQALAALKPEIVDPNFDVSYRQFQGTSFAAAAVTGGMALVRQRWQQLHPDGAPVLASTWKALAIASTSNGSPGPKVGYGNFKCAEAVRLVEKDAAGRVAGKSARIVELLLEDGESCEFAISRVPSEFQLRVVACWTDPKGISPAVSIDPRDAMLINDIDVRVESVIGGAPSTPWRFDAIGNYPEALLVNQGDNQRDNVEVIDVELAPEKTEFIVRVTHKQSLKNGEAQPISIVIEGAEAVLPPFRIFDFSETDSTNHIFTVTWMSAPGGVYQLESSPDLDAWQPILGEFIACKNTTCAELDMTGLERQFIRVRHLN
jgi:hypothetical protein